MSSVGIEVMSFAYVVLALEVKFRDLLSEFWNYIKPCAIPTIRY